MDPTDNNNIADVNDSGTTNAVFVFTVFTLCLLKWPDCCYKSMKETLVVFC